MSASTLRPCGIALALALIASAAVASPPALPEGASTEWWTQVQAGIEASEYHVTWVTGQGYQAPNRAHDFRTWFAEDGIRVVPRRDEVPAWEWGLSLSAWGRAGALQSAREARLAVHENRVDADRGGIVEWYVNDPRGLEQGFTFAARPEGEGPTVAVELALTGTLNPRLSEDGRAIDFVAPNGDRALHYAELVVTDARGKALPAWFEGFAVDRRRGIRIVVDDADAAYPVTIDPLATSPAWSRSYGPGPGNFGYALAAAGDVNGDGYGDVIVGAPNYDMGGTDAGCALVYYGFYGGLSGAPMRTITGTYSAKMGYSVATAGDVNGDGYSDVIVGAPGYNNSTGRAEVYRGSQYGLSATPVWSDVGLGYNHRFGYAVAPAGDVNGDGYGDIVIGAPGYSGGQGGEGAAFVYLGSATGLPLPAESDWQAESQAVHPYDQLTFGAAVGTAGDVNGDGYSDIIVGDSWASEAYVWHGSAAGLGASGEPGNADWSARPKTSFGAAVGTAGDVNGDGYTDVVVGAPRATITLAEEGQAFVYAGSAAGLGAAALWSRVGGQANAHYGWSVGTAGDVNGDNYADIVVGAPNYTSTYVEGGKAEVFHGSAGGPSASPNWSVAGAAEAIHYGWSVATAGDVNGDGFSDVLAGAPDNSAGLGLAEAFLGGPAGPASARIWEDEGDQAGAQFGYSVASAGDVNGDGYSEIIVGAVLFDDGQTNEGKVFVYNGSNNGPASVPSWTATSDNAEARMGYSVASAGDVNGDGYDDVIVGARGYSQPETDEGAVFVWHGSSTGLGATGVPSNADWSAQSNQASAYFGIAVSSAGDVNGDGYSDVVVGATLYDDGQTDEGEVFVWHGGADGLGKTGTPANADWRAQSDQASSRFGGAVSSAGDVNGDGIGDVVVGAYAYDNGQTNEGKVFAWYGSLAGLGSNGTPANADWSAEGNQSGAYFGFSVAGAGDVNRDTFGDAVVGAYLWDTATVTDAGKVVAFHGSADGLAVTPSWEVEGTESGARFGYAVASAGDVNGDGYADVIVGEPYYDVDEVDSGRALLYEGSAAGLPTSSSWLRGGAIGGDWYGQSVASAGDVNGDGYGDVIIGSPGKDAPDSAEGMAFVFLGNDGKARPFIPLQRRDGSDTPVARLGFSDRDDTFRITARGLPPLGRGDVMLEWEARRAGTPFSAYKSSWSRGDSWQDSGTAYAYLNEQIAVTGGLWHWRARVLYRPTTSPFQRHGRWFAQPWAGWYDGDVRTIRDGDGDGLRDEYDNCPDIANAGQEDADEDGTGDVCDSCTDIDGDGFGNPGFPANTCALDNCPFTSNADQLDFDLDATGDVCDACTDGDGDGFGDPGFPANTCALDNCPTTANPDQADGDGDGVGNVCDNCPSSANAGQEDADADGIGDACDACTDTDGDGFGNPGYPQTHCTIDNCPDVANPGQENADGDAQGDACDPDDDNDTVLDASDNCPLVANLDQLDLDADATGNACDPCTDTDGDGFANPGYPASTCATDCRPDDNTIWSAPWDVRNLRVTSAAVNNLTWEEPENRGATTIAYDVLTSEKPNDWGIFRAVCVESDGADLAATEPSLPLEGQAYYYLIRAEGPCGSNMGTRSDGTPRVGRACP